MRALRWIDPQSRLRDLDVSVCIAADETPLLSPPVEFNHWTQDSCPPTSPWQDHRRPRQQDPRTLRRTRRAADLHSSELVG